MVFLLSNLILLYTLSQVIAVTSMFNKAEKVSDYGLAVVLHLGLEVSIELLLF